MKVYWLQQQQADVPLDDDWLSPFEADRLAQLFVRKRREDWRLGRWTAKQALVAMWGRPAHSPALAEIEIRAAQSGAPEVFINHQPADATISLSHRAGAGLCVVAPAGVTLGCDLELIEPHSNAFIADYFTGEEQALVAATTSEIDRFSTVTLFWSAKESALKALHEGLRLNTRCVCVTRIDSSDPFGWTALQVRHCSGRIFDGWWRRSAQMVCTVVSDPPAEAPTALAAPASSPEGIFQPQCAFAIRHTGAAS